MLFTDVISRRPGANPDSMQILHIDCAAADGSKAGGAHHEQTMLGLTEDNFGSVILDIEIWDSFLALLFDKNLIVVFDLA